MNHPYYIMHDLNDAESVAIIIEHNQVPSRKIVMKNDDYTENCSRFVLIADYYIDLCSFVMIWNHFVQASWLDTSLQLPAAENRQPTKNKKIRQMFVLRKVFVNNGT